MSGLDERLRCVAAAARLRRHQLRQHVDAFALELRGDVAVAEARVALLHCRDW